MWERKKLLFFSCFLEPKLILIHISNIFQRKLIFPEQASDKKKKVKPWISLALRSLQRNFWFYNLTGEIRQPAYLNGEDYGLRFFTGYLYLFVCFACTSVSATTPQTIWPRQSTCGKYIHEAGGKFWVEVLLVQAYQWLVFQLSLLTSNNHMWLHVLG